MLIKGRLTGGRVAADAVFTMSTPIRPESYANIVVHRTPWHATTARWIMGGGRGGHAITASWTASAALRTGQEVSPAADNRLLASVLKLWGSLTVQTQWLASSGLGYQHQDSILILTYRCIPQDSVLSCCRKLTVRKQTTAFSTDYNYYMQMVSIYLGRKFCGTK